MQEEVAEENQQKIETEKQTVHEAKRELDKHRKKAEDIDTKYSSVRERIDQLSEEMEPLKVQQRPVVSLCAESKNSFTNQKFIDNTSLLVQARFCGFDVNVCRLNRLNVKGLKLTFIFPFIILSGVVKLLIRLLCFILVLH